MNKLLKLYLTCFTFIAFFSFKSTCILAIELYDSQNYYWHVNKDGYLAYFNGSVWEVFNSQDGLPIGKIMALVEDANKRIWVIYDDAVALVYVDSFQRVRVPENITGIAQLTITKVANTDGVVWFEDEHGTILFFDHKAHQIKRSFIKKSLAFEALNREKPTSFNFDKASNKLVTNKLPPNLYFDETTQKPLLKPLAWKRVFASTAPVKKGMLVGEQWWLLQADQRLMAVDKKFSNPKMLDFETYHLPEMKKNWTWTASAYTNSLLFLGTDQGVFLLNTGMLASKSVRLQPANYDITDYHLQPIKGTDNYVRLGKIYDILATKDTVWIAGENGLFVFLLTTRKLQRVWMGSDYYRAVTAVAKNNRLLIGTEGKLLSGVIRGSASSDTIRFESSSSDTIALEEGEHIRDIVYDAASSRHYKTHLFWVAGNKSGLSRIEIIGNDILQTFVAKTRFDEFRHIILSNDSVLWGLSLHHVARLSIEPTVKHLANARYGKFSLSDTLALNCFAIGGDNESSIYAFTNNGIWQLNLPIATNERPNIFLNSVKINGIEYPTSTKGDTLDYSRRNIILWFKGISYSSDVDIIYRYRILKPNDKSWYFNEIPWEITKNQELNLTLSEGRHQIEVIAINQYGEESSTLVRKFEIAPPIWRQKWFLWTVSFVTISVVGLVWWNEKRRLHKANQFLEMELSMLQAQMNTHFIANALTIIQGFILSNKKSDKIEALNYIVDFHTVVRLFLDASRTPKHRLDKELELIEKYIKLQQLFDHFEYSCELGEDVYATDLNVPTSLIQPFVENAIVHGLRHKSGDDKRLGIRFYRTKYVLYCEIADNGIGREASRRINEANARHKVFTSGASTEIIKKRLRTLADADAYQTTVQYEDLAKDGAPAGTKVTISIQLPKKSKRIFWGLRRWLAFFITRKKRENFSEN